MAISVEQEAQQTAEHFRQQHRLGLQPLGDLVALIEQATGHDVAILDSKPDEHGLTMLDPERGKAFIGVACSRNPMRQRSTLAHELAHLVFQDWAEDLGERSREEVRADAFARHLLVPIAGVQEFLGPVGNATEATLADVVQRFLVSPAIAAIAMRDAGFVTANIAKEWMSIPTPQLATRFGWSDYYEALQNDSNQSRAPQGLVARAVEGYAEGVVSAQAIATLRGVSVNTVVADLEAAGISPKSFDVSDFELMDLPDVDVDLSGLDGEEDSL